MLDRNKAMRFIKNIQDLFFYCFFFFRERVGGQIGSETLICRVENYFEKDCHVEKFKWC
jgi:hypothetical protein